MRRAAVAVVACALAAAAAPPGAAAQGRVPPGRPDESRGTRSGAFDRLFEGHPRLVVRPMAALLGDGTHEQRLNARATWPAADTAPDLALHLFVGFAAGRDAYSRSGLRFDIGHGLGPARFTGGATIATGFGSGPRQAASLRIGGGLPALRFEVRTTWLHGGPSRSTRTLGSGGPPLTGSGDSYDGRYTDGELDALHRLGPVALRLTAGQRFGGEARGTRQWLSGEAHIPLWHRSGIVLAGGVRPERADFAQPGGRFAQLGLRMDIRSASKDPGPLQPPNARLAAPTVVPIRLNVYLVRLHVPGARRVELKGDVTDWDVVALRRSAQDPGVWEATFHRPAGIYHVNIRADGGGWAVPPGLVAVPDRFGGSAGVLDLPPTEEKNAV